MNPLFILARIVTAGLLLWALARHPYSYYTLLRVITTATCVLGIFCAFEWERKNWAWIFGCLAVLFNPIFPVALGREIWSIVDVAVAVFLLISIPIFRVKK